MALPLDVVHRLDLDRYHEWVDGGWMEGRRVELIEGVVVALSPKGEQHERALEWLAYRFIRGLDLDRYAVLSQSALTLPGSGSETEPDLLVARVDAPRPRHFTQALLVIEVAASSLEYDRKVKPGLYAPAVEEYWVVDVEHELVEVHTGSDGTEYREAHTARAGEVLVPGALAAPEIDVAALFAAAKRR